MTERKQMKLKPYPKYKPSGVQWLGDIPEHWETTKISYGFSKIGSGTTPRSENEEFYDGDVPWVTTSELRESVITNTKNKVSLAALSTYSALRIYPAGTLLFAMYGATIGRLGVLGIPATLNQACCAFALPTKFDTRFVYYWLWMRRPILISLSSGGGQPNLSQDDLRQIRIPAAPLDEQRAIAEFLDRETAKIDRLVEKQKTLIERLKEKRTALISHVVTKGLDPKVKMKPSGIPWLGDIPEHWKVLRLKYTWSNCEYGISESLSGEGAIRVLTMGNIQDGQVVIPDRGCIDDVPPAMLLKDGDLLFNRTNSLSQVGKVGYFRNTTGAPVTFASYLVRLQTNALSSSEFMNYLLNTCGILEFARGLAFPSINQANLNPTRYGQIEIQLPPLAEQQAIAAHLDRETGRIDALVSKVEQAIERLQEYRTALISEAVTGKIDVRAK